MKNISSRQIALAFTGSFLGAGFVSGQELMQFFAVFGSYGLAGMLISILLFGMLGYFSMKIARQTGHVEFDRIIVEQDNVWLRGFFSWIFIFFLLGVLVIMIAGSGALLHQMFGMPAMAGNALTAVCAGVVALWGAQGVIAAFGIVVPLMIGTSILVSLLSFLSFGGAPITAAPFSGDNPLLGNWFFAMISFVSYNMMAAITILVPVAPHIEAENRIRTGILYGSLQLTAIFSAILLSLIMNMPMLAQTELPMLELAGKLHPFLGTFYGILLFAGMFTSALSCMFGAAFRIRRGRAVNEHLLMAGMTVLALAGSAAGFRKLIAVLYPVCGYVGFFAMAGIILHYRSLNQRRS